VRREIADEIEMRAEPRIREHAPGVAAYRKDLAALDEVMAVKLESVGLLGDGSLVDDGLPIIFAGGLKPIELEQAVCGREEIRRAELLFDGLIGDDDRPAGDKTRIEEACGLSDR
jgi:hypothetical protein